ncbi:MAG: hypothetical protein KDC92_00485 [Bacteroidetes bacterium]|nr:hypothetical protein [Bacteroidota bacterium]
MAFSQKWEAGIFGGVSHYNGDFSEGLIELEHTHMALGGLLKYNYAEKITLRGGLYYGTISGDDVDASDIIRRDRNLHFTSTITEFSLVPEFNLTGYNISRNNLRFTPFVYAGLGVFKFNPYATSTTGGQVYLQPLRTEGQGAQYFQQPGKEERKPYALTQINVPIGVGIKFRLAGNFTMTIEASARKVFTDYLDDVSKTYISDDIINSLGGQELTGKYSDNRLGIYDYGSADINSIPRGNSTYQDWYYYHGIGITYTFFPPRCFKF